MIDAVALRIYRGVDLLVTGCRMSMVVSVRKIVEVDTCQRDGAAMVSGTHGDVDEDALISKT